MTVLSHQFWRALQWSSTVISRAIVLNGTPFTVVGVAAEGFHGELHERRHMGADDGESVVRHSGGVLAESRGGAWIMAIGRLKPGVGIAQAQADLATISPSNCRRTRKPTREKVFACCRCRAFPGDLRRMVSLFTTFLFVLTGLVLVIGGTSMAGMLLARAAARRREIAVRLALVHRAADSSAAGH